MNTKRTAKVALATFGLSVMMPAAAFAATDTQGHWAGSVLEKWESQALISGYEDGTIRPDNQISRAEFVALVNRAAGYAAAGTAVNFSDVATGDWYAGQVAIAVSQGYIGGFEDNTFRPNDNVTRAQAAAIIARIKDLKADTAKAAQFADAASIPDWAKGVVGAVANAGYMIGDEANNFNAEKALTRAEAVASLDRVFGVKDLEAQTLTLSATEGVVAKNGSKTIKATSSVEGAEITATSSDTDVATVTVKDGKVTIKGVAKGEATITVTAKANGYKIATATYEVTVTAAIGGGGGGSSSGGHSTPVVTPDAPSVDVTGVTEVAEKMATNAVNSVLTSLDENATVQAKVDALSAMAEAEASTAVEKVAAKAAADYLAENENATEKDLQEAAQEAVTEAVKDAAKDVESELGKAEANKDETVTVEVPAILSEVAKTAVIETNKTELTAEVGEKYSIELREGALDNFKLTVQKDGSATQPITAKNVLDYIDAGTASAKDDVKALLKARENDTLITGTADWTGDTLKLKWSSNIAQLTDDEVNDFAKSFGISFK